MVGGTTWHWGGLAMRFRPNDFRLKSEFGVGVDWPFGYDELEPWYEDAEDEIGVSGDDDFDWGAPRKSGYPMPKIPMSYADTVVGAAATQARLHHRAVSAGAEFGLARRPAAMLRQRHLRADLPDPGEV